MPMTAALPSSALISAPRRPSLRQQRGRRRPRARRGRGRGRSRGRLKRRTSAVLGEVCGRAWGSEGLRLRPASAASHCGLRGASATDTGGTGARKALEFFFQLQLPDFPSVGSCMHLHPYQLSRSPRSTVESLTDTDLHRCGRPETRHLRSNGNINTFGASSEAKHRQVRMHGQPAKLQENHGSCGKQNCLGRKSSRLRSVSTAGDNMHSFRPQIRVIAPTWQGTPAALQQTRGGPLGVARGCVPEGPPATTPSARRQPGVLAPASLSGL